MKKYGVTCTMIYNGYIEVEAENEEEAFGVVEDMLSCDNICDFPDSGKWGKVEFDFGEATADYADEIK